MGNNPQAQSKPSLSFSPESFERSYVYEKEVNDPRFGLIKIYRNRAQSDVYVMVLVKSSLDASFETFLRELEVRSSLRHENLCRILGHSQESLQRLCGASTTLTIYSEYEKNTLEKELQKKSASKVL